MAFVVAENLADVHLGKYLPDSMPREKRERVIKAEAMWMGGVNSPDEIARVCGVSKASIYSWAATFHWKKRADIAQLGQEALRAANMVTIAAKARAAAAQSAEKAEANTSGPASNQSVAGDPDVVDLLAQRGARPMPEDEAARAAIVQQAVADAHQNTIIALFVEAISKITDDQRDLTNMLVAHGTEMARDLAASYTQWKANKPKTITAKEIREEVAKQLPLYRQLVSALAQAINLQRRVWMIADAGKASLDDGDGFDGGWDGGLERTRGGPGVPVAVPKDTYEASVLKAERAGIDLTKKGPA